MVVLSFLGVVLCDKDLSHGRVKPKKLEKVSFVELRLKDNSRKKVSENSLPVAPEVVKAKTTLVGEKEDFPSFSNFKRKMASTLKKAKQHFENAKDKAEKHLKNAKNKVEEEASRFHAAGKDRMSKVKKYLNNKVKSGESADKVSKGEASKLKKNSSVSVSLSSGYLMVFCLSLFLIR